MLQAERVSFTAGAFALQEVSLHAGPGEYFVLLGPPGSGKTIFLECLCGLRRLKSGTIRVDGAEVTRWEPRRRQVGYVPQDYALFPHLSVAENIGFGLRYTGLAAQARRTRVQGTAALLGIEPLLGRGVGGLSGGERQRVALGRALVLKPKVLLLDEPVSALDELMRETICQELRRLQREIGVTTIHVSHNLEEAFSLADRAGVLRDGRFAQIGTMEELLNRPRNEFVARFMRCENILTGQVVGWRAEEGMSRVRVGAVEMDLPGRHEGTIRFVIRPENVQVYTAPLAERGVGIELALRPIKRMARGAYGVVVLGDGLELKAHLPMSSYRRLAGDRWDETQRLNVILPYEFIHILPE